MISELQIFFSPVHGLAVILTRGKDKNTKEQKINMKMENTFPVYLNKATFHNGKTLIKNPAKNHSRDQTL